MSWQHFVQSTFAEPALGFRLDTSRLPLAPGFVASLAAPLRRAFADMEALEKGAIANPDENRRVGHYWLRTPELAPDPEIASAITGTLRRIRALAADVHAGRVTGSQGPFTHVLVVGIGGSALGPQLANQALGHPDRDRMQVAFLDNTDPDGFDLVLAGLRPHLTRTLVLVVSKSGGTVETRNGMLETAAAFRAAGIPFPRHAVAITGEGSRLDRQAVSEGWIARFPMWDWVGGRTSEFAAVGLLPAALQGIDIDAFLDGARAMDAVTRRPDLDTNPAARMAACWYHATEGRGSRDLVVLPYKDRLLLLSRYLQQLLMESLGKELDLDGRPVWQGLSCYGNKGSTDQHAYVQQLREGVRNFFVTFIEVLRDREGPSPEVEPGVTSGDYLQGFLLGTREALSEKGRESLTITVPDVSPRSLGMLIALFERTVGIYASLIHINAYHQPGVEAGKKAAGSVVALKTALVRALQTSGRPLSALEAAAAAGSPGQAEIAFYVLERLAANGLVRRHAGATWHEARYAAP